MGFPNQIGRVWLKEQASGWGTEETSFADADHISAKAFVPTLVQEALKVDTFRGGFHDLAIEPGSKEGADLQIQHSFEGHSSTSPTDNPAENPRSLLLKSCLGSAASIGYLAAIENSGQAVNSVKYANGSLATTWAGMAVLLSVAAAASGRQFAWAKTIDTASNPDALVPWLDLLGAPTNSSRSYGGRVHWLSLGQPVPFTAQLALGQADGNAVVRARDGVCTSIKMTCVGNQLIDVVYGTKYGSWSRAGSWTPAIYAQTYPPLPMLDAANGARLQWGGSSLSVIPEVVIEMSATMEPVRHIGGFAKWLMTSREVKVTLTHLLDDYTQIIAPGTEVTTGFQLDLCTIPGRAAGAFIPTTMAEAVSKDKEMGGFVVREHTLKCRIAGSETAGANASGSPFRFVTA